VGKKSSDGANPRTTASKLAHLAQIKKEIHVDQANESITKQHAKGKQSARERLALVDLFMFIPKTSLPWVVL